MGRISNALSLVLLVWDLKEALPLCRPKGMDQFYLHGLGMRSTLPVIWVSDVHSDLQCMMYAERITGLGCNVIRLADSEMFRCEILGCSENASRRTLVQDSSSTYYSTYRTLPPEDYFCVSQVGFYRLYKEGRNFYDARAICFEDGTDLADIESAEENEVLRTTVASQISPHSKMHTGYYQYDGYVFISVRGEFLSCIGFINWQPYAPAEPILTDGENCVDMNPDGTWYVSNVDWNQPFVCEYFREP